jgi:D-alanyl-D-alanine carboxypeptidase (penicillin-binding protein 5/6)
MIKHTARYGSILESTHRHDLGSGRGRRRDSYGFSRQGSYVSRSRGRHRRRSPLRLILLILLIAAVFCGVTAYRNRVVNPYRYEERLANYPMEHGGTLEMFAQKLCVPDPDEQFDDTGITAEAGVLFSTDDQKVLYAKEPYEKLYPASITKIMTAILALEDGNMDDMVTVTNDAVITEPGASLCGIQPGDQISMKDLVHGLLLPSGNDAANAIAVQISGSVDAFVEAMNQKAQKLGCTGTHFTNPSGLQDENHYTTAYDIYLMFNEALKIPEFREIISTASYAAEWTGADGNPVKKTWSNSNWYLTGRVKTPSGLTVLGGKTGTTIAAGACLVMDTEDADGKNYISVVMKAQNRQNLYDNMTNIISKINR